MLRSVSSASVFKFLTGVVNLMSLTNDGEPSSGRKFSSSFSDLISSIPWYGRTYDKHLEKN